MSTQIEKLPTFTRTKLGPGHYAIDVHVGDPVNIQIIKRFGPRPGRMRDGAVPGWAVVIVGVEVDRKPTLREAQEYVEQWIQARARGVRDRIAQEIAAAVHPDAVAILDTYSSHATDPCHDTRLVDGKVAHGDTNVVVQFPNGGRKRLCLLHAQMLPPLPTDTPRPAAAPGPLAPYVDAVERAVEDLRKQAAAGPPFAEPITVAEFEARTAEHPLDNLFDLDNVLADRIVRRAKYDALREVIRVIDAWHEGMAENHVALEHLDDDDGCLKFEVSDVRRIVNDTAGALGVPAPWRPEAGA